MIPGVFAHVRRCDGLDVTTAQGLRWPSRSSTTWARLRPAGPLPVALRPWCTPRAPDVKRRSRVECRPLGLDARYPGVPGGGLRERLCARRCAALASHPQRKLPVAWLLGSCAYCRMLRSRGTRVGQSWRSGTQSALDTYGAPVRQAVPTPSIDAAEIKTAPVRDACHSSLAIV